jgi:hypothetical protein
MFELQWILAIKGGSFAMEMTCPYCGLRAETHFFLTPGQLKYVRAYFEFLDQATARDRDAEYVIDMDQVADAAGKEGEKPEFYYSEESQQNNYTCTACGDRNDILGRYGYCSTCGTHNGFTELKNDIKATRHRMEATQHHELVVKDVVSAFDAYARHISQQLAARIPMTKRRRDEWKRKLFHNSTAFEGLKSCFDVDVSKGLRQEDADFCSLMFHRRHVYEHNGGQVDEKYMRDSGDSSVRLGQVIRESRDSALRIGDLVTKMGENLHNGFHEIFPPEALPLQIHQERLDRIPRR